MGENGVLITVIATTQSFASARDKNPIDGDVNYYGVIQDIIEVDKKIVLFKCDLVFNGRGLK